MSNIGYCLINRMLGECDSTCFYFARKQLRRLFVHPTWVFCFISVSVVKYDAPYDVLDFFHFTELCVLPFIVFICRRVVLIDKSLKKSKTRNLETLNIVMSYSIAIKIHCCRLITTFNKPTIILEDVHCL